MAQNAPGVATGYANETRVASDSYRLGLILAGINEKDTVLIRASIIAAFVLSLSGCSLLPFGGGQKAHVSQKDSLIENNPAIASLVATDLVNALSQIRAIKPNQTTLYAQRPQDQLGERMIKSLQESGYKLRLATDNQQPLLAYDVIQEEVEAGYTVVVSAGLVKVKRRYDVNGLNLTVHPISSLFVLGASGDEIQLDDSIFDKQQLTILAQQATPEIQDNTVAVAQAIAVPDKPELIKQPLRLSNADQIARKKPVKKFNMYEMRRSNYDDILGEFNTVSREIMIFPNDSLVMGQDNKTVAAQIVDRFNEESDVISVIGCSHGKTAIDDGNQKLANGRADRVKEEFTLAGINPDLVLQEACWANVHFDEMMPRRGVVVTHKRKI